MRLFALLFCLPTLCLAQEAMDGAAFDAFTRGKTFYYGQDGQAYGAEDYLEDRRVRWSFLDGECKEGYWYDTPDREICFVYEDRPDAPQCWSFFNQNGKLVARFENQEAGTLLYETEKSDKPMLCHGPKIGV